MHPVGNMGFSLRGRPAATVVRTSHRKRCGNVRLQTPCNRCRSLAFAEANVEGRTPTQVLPRRPVANRKPALGGHLLRRHRRGCVGSRITAWVGRKIGCRCAIAGTARMARRALRTAGTGPHYRRRRKCPLRGMRRSPRSVFPVGRRESPGRFPGRATNSTHARWARQSLRGTSGVGREPACCRRTSRGASNRASIRLRAPICLSILRAPPRFSRSSPVPFPSGPAPPCSDYASARSPPGFIKSRGGGGRRPPVEVRVAERGARTRPRILPERGTPP